MGIRLQRPAVHKVDLGAENVISRVLLNWENAAGKSYTVDVSADGKAWKTVYATTNGKPGASISASCRSRALRESNRHGTDDELRLLALWNSKYTAERHGLPSAPELNADTTDAVVGQPIVVTFDDDAAWRSAINAVKIDGIAVGAGQYAVTEGKIALNAGLFAKAGAYAITVEAKDYAERGRAANGGGQKCTRTKIAGAASGTRPGHNPDQTNPNPLNLAFTGRQPLRRTITVRAPTRSTADSTAAGNRPSRTING